MAMSKEQQDAQDKLKQPVGLPDAPLTPEQEKNKPAMEKVEKILVMSPAGPMLDTETNKWITGAAFHEKTKWLDAQMAAGKIVPATDKD